MFVKLLEFILEIIFVFPLNLLMKSPLAFALLYSIPLVIWLYFSVRKKRRFGLVLSIVLLLFVWYTPALQASAYVTFGLHAMAQPEGRDVKRVRYYWDSKRAVTDVYAVYTDEPSTTYHYIKWDMLTGFYDWPATIEPEWETYPVGVTEVSGKWALTSDWRWRNGTYTQEGDWFSLQRFNGERWVAYDTDAIFDEERREFAEGDGISFSLELFDIGDEGLEEGRYRIEKTIYYRTVYDNLERKKAYCFFEVE